MTLYLFSFESSQIMKKNFFWGRREEKKNWFRPHLIVLYEMCDCLHFYDDFVIVNCKNSTRFIQLWYKTLRNFIIKLPSVLPNQYRRANNLLQASPCFFRIFLFSLREYDDFNIFSFLFTPFLYSYYININNFIN